MHESERRDWVRQYLRGWEAQIAAVRVLETRVDALERKRREREVRLRVGRPWEAERISRSAWYRKRQSSGSPRAGSLGNLDGDAVALLRDLANWSKPN